MGRILIDTNLIIDDENILFKLKDKYEKIVIPLTVLKELDKLKNKPDTSYSARKAIRSIRTFQDLYPDSIHLHVNDSLFDINDTKIIEAAKENNAIIATKDISMSVIANSMSIETKLYDAVMNNIYNPYIQTTTDIFITNFEQTAKEQFCFEQQYKDKNYKNIQSVVELNYNRSAIGWYFIFIKDPGKDKEYVYAHNPIEQCFDRLDNNNKYFSLIVKDPSPTELKAADIYQVCAIYALLNAPNVMITGTWGSGKSLLATTYSLRSKNKVFLTRAPIGINKKYDLGFMPGSKSEKMLDWVSGVISSLYFLFANTRGQTMKGMTYDFVKDELFTNKFEPTPINSIQGLSLLENDILMVDEIQLLDVDTMSMILSRPSKNGKLILLGDLGQTYSTVKPSESGLLKLLRILPHKSIAYVELQKTLRGSIVELADKLQDRTIS